MSKHDPQPLSKDATRVTSNSGNDEHGTPIQFARRLMDAVGGIFTLDPCSGAEPQPIAENRFTKEDNGLAQDWFGEVYVNPPYSELEKWLKKVTAEINRSEPDAPSVIICLVPAYTSAGWFQNYATQADLLSLVAGRMSFHGSKNDATFHSALLAFGEITEDIAEAFDELGTIYTRVQVANATKQQRLDDLFRTDGGAVATPTGTGTHSYPEMTPGPAVRDLSRASTTTGGFYLSSLSVRDEIYVEFDTTMMGFPTDVPSELQGTVLSGTPPTTERTQTPDDWHTVLCIHEETETYFCLYQDPNTVTDMRCSLAPEGYGWTDVHLNTVHRMETHQGPSAYGYVDMPHTDETA